MSPLTGPRLALSFRLPLPCLPCGADAPAPAGTMYSGESLDGLGMDAEWAREPVLPGRR